MTWPRAAWTCWSRNSPEWWDWGILGGPCCNTRGACASCPRWTVAPRFSPISGRTGSGRRRRKCGGPVWPWDQTPYHQSRPAHGPCHNVYGSLAETGRGLHATCGDVEPNPGPGHAEAAGFPRQVLPLDISLTAPGIRGHFALQPDAPGQTLWWCVRCGMSWQAPQATETCPEGCAPTAGPPRRGQQSWPRHRQLVIDKRSPDHQALRRAGRIDMGTSTPRIDDPCAGLRWNRQYYTWRRLLHSLAVVLALRSVSPRAGRPGHTQPRTMCVLSRAIGVPLFRQRGLPPVLRGCGDKPRPASPGLGGGRLRCLA